MDLFDHMQTFVRVVEGGSITGAADSLDVAKSAVSRRLSDLEARLGAQLFRRTTPRLSLADTGQGYYERCIRILADVEEAELSVAQAHGLVRGRLRVAMPVYFGVLHLGPAITDFMQLHPRVTFDLDFKWPKLEAYAVYPQTRHVSSRVRVFVDFLVERFSGVPYWDRRLGASCGPSV